MPNLLKERLVYVLNRDNNNYLEMVNFFLDPDISLFDKELAFFDLSDTFSESGAFNELSILMLYPNHKSVLKLTNISK